ncbi:MAG: ATP-binding protein [Hyphomicrobiaceae bacterium]
MTALARLVRSTPFRLALGYAAVFALAGAAIFATFAWRANQLLTTSVVETLGAEITGLREQFEAGGAARLAETVATRVRAPGAALYLLTDAEGRKIAGNLDRLPDRTGPGSTVFRYSAVANGDGRPRLAVGVPVSVPGGFTLLVGRDVEDQRRFASAMQWIAVAGLGLLTALALAGGLLVARSVGRRIDAVNAASQTIMAGDLSQRIPVAGSDDELDRLAVSLNAMLARIEELMEALRQVSDNIAHDLKTPLTRMRNRAEAALRDPRGAEACREGLEHTIEEADDLIRTFNALLRLARLEAGAVADSVAPVDVAAIVHEVGELYEPVTEEAGFRFSVSADKGLTVLANRELIGQAIANLIDNALKYSKVDAVAPAQAQQATPQAAQEVTVTAHRVPSGIEIAVADRGPGIPADDRARALKRFVRLESSRSRPGSGLGLSLVAAVARLHGGELRLEDNAPGLRVVMTLPALATPVRVSPEAVAG